MREERPPVDRALLERVRERMHLVPPTAREPRQGARDATNEPRSLRLSMLTLPPVRRRAPTAG